MLQWKIINGMSDQFESKKIKWNKNEWNKRTNEWMNEWT